jgi:tetratricopeptide (TPR) repeat protein
VTVHSDDEVPSIAIIPFDNKGADEDVFYAYGISADLISDCSGAGLIRVASLKDVEKLDYSNMETSELSEKLLVRYIAQGTLWKMGDMFQLSVELYDTKDKKVVWSDRWQEKWDNLTTIKMNLSDGLLKALDTKPKVKQKIETTNPEAYEFYLKAKHKYEKRESAEDREIAKGLFNKAIKIDDSLIMAKVKLGWIYIDSGDYNKAMEILTPALNKAEEIGDKRGLANVINAIGVIHHDNNDCDKAMDYYNHSLKIGEAIGDKLRIAGSLNNIGHIYFTEGDYEKAIVYFERAGKKFNEINEKYFAPFGWLYYFKGDYDIALDYLNKALKGQEEIGDKVGIGETWCGLGVIYFEKGDYKKAKDYLEKSLVIVKEIDRRSRSLLSRTLPLFLCYKKISKEYNVSEIYTLIKKQNKISRPMAYFINNFLYQLLEDTSYLETAYNQVQEQAGNLESDVAAKFLSYPIPKAIVEEWEKVK